MSISKYCVGKHWHIKHMRKKNKPKNWKNSSRKKKRNKSNICKVKQKTNYKKCFVNNVKKLIEFFFWRIHGDWDSSSLLEETKLNILKIFKESYLNNLNRLIFVYFIINLQSLKKYLRQTLLFMWNSTLKEKFNFCYSGDFH